MTARPAADRAVARPLRQQDAEVQGHDPDARQADAVGDRRRAPARRSPPPRVEARADEAGELTGEAAARSGTRVEQRGDHLVAVGGRHRGRVGADARAARRSRVIAPSPPPPAGCAVTVRAARARRRASAASSSRPLLGQRVVAPPATALDVGLAGHDQPRVGRALQQRVQRARRQADLAVGQLGRAAQDRVAVQRAVEQGRQREVARRPELHGPNIRRSSTCRQATRRRVFDC